MPERYRHDPDTGIHRSVERKLIDAHQGGAYEAGTGAAGLHGTGFSSANINRRARDPKGGSPWAESGRPDGPPDRPDAAGAPDGSPIAWSPTTRCTAPRSGRATSSSAAMRPESWKRTWRKTRRADAVRQRRGRQPRADLHRQNDFQAAHITEFNVLLGDRILEPPTAEAPLARSASGGRKDRRDAPPRRHGWDASMATTWSRTGASMACSGSR